MPQAIFLDAKTIDMYPHSLIAIQSAGQVATYGPFLLNAASNPVVMNATFTDEQKGNPSYNSDNQTMFLEGYVNKIYPYRPPVANTEMRTMGRNAPTGAVVGNTGFLFAKDQIFAIATKQGTTKFWGLSAFMYGSSPKQKVAFGPLYNVMPSGDVILGTNIFECNFYGLTYAGMAVRFVQQPQMINCVGMKLWNSSAYPGAITPTDLVGAQNPEGLICPTDVALYFKAVPGPARDASDSPYMCANIPDYGEGKNIRNLNYALWRTAGTPYVIKWSRWQMKDSGHPLDEQAYEPLTFALPPWTYVPLDNSYLNYQNIQSTTKGFLLKLTKPFAYNGKNWYFVLLSANAQFYTLIDFNFTYNTSALDPNHVPVTTFSPSTTAGVHCDKDGYFYTSNQIGSNCHIGISRQPLAQYAVPKLTDPSIIPTAQLGCFTRCNTFPTFPPQD